MSTLHQLRDFLMQGSALPVLDGDWVVLGSRRLPRHSRTAWRFKKGTYLELDSIVFLLHNEQLKLSEYIRAAQAADVQLIPFGERKHMLDFLRGASDANSAYIDQEVIAEQQQAAARGEAPATGRKAAAGDAAAAPPSDVASAAVASAGSRGGEGVGVGSKRSRSMVEDAADFGESAGQQGSAQAGKVGSGAEAADGSGDASVPGSGGSSLLPPWQWRLSDVLREEVVHLNRVSCLQGSKDLSAIGALWDATQTTRERRKKDDHRPASTSNPHSSSSSSPSSTPIILVPASLSSCLSLFNAQSFLEDGLLIPTAIKRAEHPTAPKPPFVRIHRPSVLHPPDVVSFDVLDDTSVLKADDWRRVVAIFVSGSAWQFEGWPHPFTSPAVICAAVPAFYLAYADEPVNKNVQQWKVHTLVAHRMKNYADRSLQMEFWNITTEHLRQQHKHKHITF